MTEKKDINELQVNAWKVIEALAERQYDLASVEELAGDVGITIPQARRILLTWEELGIVEARGTMYRLTEVLMTRVPARLKLGLAEKFKNLETPGSQERRGSQKDQAGVRGRSVTLHPMKLGEPGPRGIEEEAPMMGVSY